MKTTTDSVHSNSISTTDQMAMDSKKPSTTGQGAGVHGTTDGLGHETHTLSTDELPGQGGGPRSPATLHPDDLDKLKAHIEDEIQAASERISAAVTETIAPSLELLKPETLASIVADALPGALRAGLPELTAAVAKKVEEDRASRSRTAAIHANVDASISPAGSVEGRLTALEQQYGRLKHML